MGLFDSKEKRAEAALAAIAGPAARGIEALPGQQRCGTLIIANALLASLSHELSVDIGRNPATLGARQAAVIVLRLAEIHRRLTDLLASQEENPDSSIVKAAALRQLHAVEAVMLLSGIVLHKSARAAAAGCWKSLWLSRRHGADAVKLLRRDESALGMEAVPRIEPKRRVSRDDMKRLAGELPAVFRSKARSGNASTSPHASRGRTIRTASSNGTLPERRE